MQPSVPATVFVDAVLSALDDLASFWHFGPPALTMHERIRILMAIPLRGASPALEQWRKDFRDYLRNTPQQVIIGSEAQRWADNLRPFK